MDELEDRVRRAALEAMTGEAALAPRDAARVERTERREQKVATSERVASLRAIVRKLRAALKDRGDVGTASFVRRRKHRATELISRAARGWAVATLAAEVVLRGEFAGARRSCELQLVLLTDGKVYAAKDGTLYDRFRLGQSYHPEMPVTFPLQAWRDLEDRIPEFAGELVGRLQLAWEVD